jgi:5,10-methylenetetrahydromethanopterin reductase
MVDRVGLFLQDDFSLKESLDFVKYAEARGFDSAWQAETRLVRDSAVPIAAYAAVTSRIKVGSGVMNIWTRNAATIAAEFLTLDDLAQDRVICGLGAWYDPLAAQVGVNRHKHLLAMREVVTAVRRLLHMERVTFQGEIVHLDDVVLDVTHGRKEARRIPIYIGAVGPKMMALAGEIADGVLLNYLVSPRYNEMAVSQIEIGAKQAQRSIFSIDRPQLILCSVHANPREAINAARPIVAQYIIQQPDMMRANGVHHALIDDLLQLANSPASANILQQATKLVTDDVVRLVTASGTAEECRAKVREYIAAGATYPVLYPINPDVRLMIDAFANGYSQ